MTVGFVTFEKNDNRITGTIGSTRIRARWVYEKWDGAEEYRLGKKYDVLVFQKVYWEQMMLGFKGIKILDLCDPDWLDGKDVFRYISLADAITTSTTALKDYIQRFTKVPVYYVADRINFDEHKKVKETQRDTIKKAIWFGYSQNMYYIKNTLEHLARYNIELTIVSDRSDTFKDSPVKIRNVGYNYPGIHQELINSDIALLPDPALKDMKGRFKSNNKSTTCWALQVPVVQTPEDLIRLQSRREREIEVEEKFALVRKDYDVNQSVREYEGIINQCVKDRTQKK